MTPNVNILQHPEDPMQRVVLFEPPVASWVFSGGHTLDELWVALLQASGALLQEPENEEFTPAAEARVKDRISGVLRTWISLGWLTIP